MRYILSLSIKDSSDIQTVASLMWLMIAILQFPEVQEEAQKELDSVVGRDRLPTWEDRDNLVYIEALIREVLRWRPMVPLSKCRNVCRSFIASYPPSVSQVFRISQQK